MINLSAEFKLLLYLDKKVNSPNRSNFDYQYSHPTQSVGTPNQSNHRTEKSFSAPLSSGKPPTPPAVPTTPENQELALETDEMIFER